MELLQGGQGMLSGPPFAAPTIGTPFLHRVGTFICYNARCCSHTSLRRHTPPQTSPPGWCSYMQFASLKILVAIRGHLLGLDVFGQPSIFNSACLHYGSWVSWSQPFWGKSRSSPIWCAWCASPSHHRPHRSDAS